MTAPTLFGKPMQPDVLDEGWELRLGIFDVRVNLLVGGGFGGVVRHGHHVVVRGGHSTPQAAAAECEAWLMRTMLETAGAMGFELRRGES